MSEDVFRRARELEGRFWHVAGDEGAEREFVDFLRANRSELESDPHWEAYIADLDRVGLLEPTDRANPDKRHRTERAEWTQGSSADDAVTRPSNRAARGRRP